MPSWTRPNVRKPLSLFGDDLIIIDIRTMSPGAIAEAKEFAEKENLRGVVRWVFVGFD